MSENLLEREHIRAAMLIHERCGGMPKLMRRETFSAESCRSQVILDDLLHSAAADPPVIAAEKERVWFFGRIVAHGKIILYRRKAGVIEIDNAFLAALSEHAYLPIEEVQISGIHADQLRKPESAVEKQRNDAVIAEFFR